MKKLLLIFLLGVFVCRLILFFLIQAHDPSVFVESDSMAYYHLGQNLLNYGSFQLHLKPEIFRTPGYPLFIAACINFFGQGFTGISIIQIFLSCVSIWLVYEIALIVFAEEKVAFFSALLYSFDPWTYQMSLLIGPDLLFTFLILVFIWLMAILIRKSSHFLFAYFIGCVFAASVFVRPLLLYLIFPLACFLVFYIFEHKHDVKERLKISGIIISVPILFVGAWFLRNYYQAGVFVFSSIPAEHLYWNIGGQILAYINHTSLDIESTRLSLQSLVLEKASLKSMLDYCMHNAWQIFIAHPFLLIKTLIKGMWLVLWSPGTLFFRDYLAGHNNMLRELIKWFGIWYLASIYLLSGIGMYLLTSTKQWRLLPIMLLLVLMYLIIFSATPVGYYRFRVPFWPIVCVFASYVFLKYRPKNL